MSRATLVVVAGTTETAAIDGISAAGADPTLRRHTPSADLEIVADGSPAPDSPVPVSPSGCPTPAVITRAVRELAGFDLVGIDAGLAVPTAVDTCDAAAAPGDDIRDATPVPDAATILDRGRVFARDIAAVATSDAAEDSSAVPDELLLAETIPGGTTTALGVLAALGERPSVSSSLAANPLERKRRIVEAGLAASDLDAGGAAGDPIAAIRHMGDPVLAAATGVLIGAAEADIDVTLAGGTQLAAVAALARHAGISRRLPLATTSFVADDPTADLSTLAADLSLSLVATDPEFDAADHPAMRAYARGEAKEGVGMGGALALADRAGISSADVRERVALLTDRLLAEREAQSTAAVDGGGPS